MTNEKIARINELAKKSKTTGLTDAEKAAVSYTHLTLPTT